MKILGITGSPGTGKKAVGRLAAKRLKYTFIDLNQLAVEGGAILGEDEHGFIADTEKLRRLVREKMGGGNAVVSGHLLPEIFTGREVRLVAVLRCSPWELEERYAARGYPQSKVKENIAAEILDICFAEAVKRFGVDRVVELDTTGRKPGEVAQELVDIYQGRRGRRWERVNWLERIAERGEMTRYFNSLPESLK